MARPPKREIRPANLRCLENDHHFVAEVPWLGHYVEEHSEPTLWVVESTAGVTCPKCGSRVEPVKR